MKSKSSVEESAVGVKPKQVIGNEVSSAQDVPSVGLKPMPSNDKIDEYLAERLFLLEPMIYEAMEPVKIEVKRMQARELELEAALKIKEEVIFEQSKRIFSEGLRVTHLWQCLKGLQWAGADEHHNPMCPVCGEGFWNHNGKLLKERNNNPQHKADCWLGHELGK